MQKMFEPLTIRNMTLRNRFVVPPMVTCYVKHDGKATEKLIAYHEMKAKGGFGLIIVEDYEIAPKVGGFIALPGLYDDEQIESHKKLTDRVHAQGAKIMAQIYHAGRESSLALRGVQPVAPSAIKDPSMLDIPHELTKEEILTIIEQFGDCALRAKKAGFDGVEVHGAHGYLVNQFASAFSNKRTDEYGGSIANRAKFAVDIVKNIRAKVGEDFVIGYRMSVEEYVDGGLTAAETQVLAQLLEAASVDLIHCSQGVYASTQHIIPPSAVPRAHYVNNAAAIKSVVNIPVIAVGRINDPLIAENIVASGKADLVAMGRGSIADPFLPNKAKEGRFDDIIRCIACNQGCSGENSKQCAIRCLVNPLTGMESEYDLTPVAEPKTVYVVGGGVAGAEAAITAAKKGHKVTLFEKDDRLGGQWIAASVPIAKGEFITLPIHQSKELTDLGVEVKYNTLVNKKMIEDAQPQVVIVATGGKATIPPIKGIEQENVVLAQDVLLGKVAVGKNIVVIGGGSVGAETADHLAYHGSNVTIVEMTDEIDRDGEPNPKRFLMRRLVKNNIAMYTSSTVEKIESDVVSIKKADGSIIDLNGIDSVVLATGVKSDDELAKELSDYTKGKVYVVGDAASPKNGYRNIREAYETALAL